MPVNKSAFILDEKNDISNFIAQISYKTYEYINEKKDSSFVLFYKYLTHSDLATFGKATRVNHHEDNYLYYLTKEQMDDIENKTGKPFQTAHQSCVGLKKQFYRMLDLKDPREKEVYLINDYMNVFLVNDSLKYFSSKYTRFVFEQLGKTISPIRKKNWDFDDLNVDLTNTEFTPINLHVAVHGLGLKNDEEFHKLRHHMFKGDTFILLYENDTSANTKNLFIILEKNPAFFTIIGETNHTYEEYQERTRARIIAQIRQKPLVVKTDQDVEDEVTRQQQSAWRKMLANEMIGYTQSSDEVFCPFTYIAADFKTLGALFVASHIKGFSDPNTKDSEKYDINNGLLLCANADALFDKHLISVDENKHLVFSFLLDGDVRLKQELLLLQPIFQPIFNDKRMTYLKYHKQVFDTLEIQRKHNSEE